MRVQDHDLLLLKKYVLFRVKDIFQENQSFAMEVHIQCESIRLRIDIGCLSISLSFEW